MQMISKTCTFFPVVILAAFVVIAEDWLCGSLVATSVLFVTEYLIRFNGYIA